MSIVRNLVSAVALTALLGACTNYATTATPEAAKAWEKSLPPSNGNGSIKHVSSTQQARMEIPELGPTWTNPPLPQDAPILARVASIGLTPGRDFDPSKLSALDREAVDAVPTDDPARHRTIASVERPGYLDGDRLIRPAQVVVHRYDGAPADRGVAGDLEAV